MTLFHSKDIIQSVARSLQFISYQHPQDYVEALAQAYRREEATAAKDAMAQILQNSKMAAKGHRPICQDTGLVIALIKIGMQSRFEPDAPSFQAIIDKAVEIAYQDQSNPLRASMVQDPAGQRINTRTNAPASVHIEFVPGNSIEITLAAKGGGSENKTRMAMLNPSDSVVDWIVDTVESLGSGWCPPGVLGVGIGGSPDQTVLLAKKALMEPIDLPQLKARGAKTTSEKLRLELYDRINALGIGAQGLGGMTTVVDVKVRDIPTHAASLPVAIVPNCAANRHIHFTLQPGEVFEPTPVPLSAYPEELDQKSSNEQSGKEGGSLRKVDLNSLTQEKIETFKSGETLLLSGTILTGRDAAHKRLVDLFEAGKPLPEGVDLEGKLIYYVGPVPAVGDEAVGPAGPTTATRMDKYTEAMLTHTGLLGMIGKAERGTQTVELLKKHKKVYLIAVGGAAYLVSKAIKKAKVLAFEDLGMEAIHEFEVEDMPVTVAVDSKGNNLHQTGPSTWKKKLSSSVISSS